MFPWLWIWAPRVDFPLSGNVTQDIAPEWFFSAIKPTAGHAELEQEIFMNSSYGKQLGVMMDVLLPLAEGKSIDSEALASAVQKLQSLNEQIEQIKASHGRVSKDSINHAKATLSALQAEHPDLLQSLIAPFVNQRPQEDRS